MVDLLLNLRLLKALKEYFDFVLNNPLHIIVNIWRVFKLNKLRFLG